MNYGLFASSVFFFCRIAVRSCVYCTWMTKRKKNPTGWNSVALFTELLGSTDLVFASTDGLKQTVLCAVERQTPWEKDEENDSTAPHVHRFTIRLPLHHLRGHEVRGPHAAWGETETDVAAGGSGRQHTWSLNPSVFLSFLYSWKWFLTRGKCLWTRLPILKTEGNDVSAPFVPQYT